MLSFLYNVYIAPIELIIEMFFAFLMKPLDSVGLSIVGISVFVSLLTLPLYHIADQLQKKDRDQRLALKPSIDRIKAVFKGDEQYMILNTFYKQNNYHPIYALRNSLSLLIQIPFFIAAYHFLSNLNLLKGQGFLFIKDLGVNDAFATIGPLTINILPILMTIINLGSAIIYTKGFPLRDRIQTFGIPIIFLILLYNSPSGLVFYWTLNNIFSLIKNIVYKMKKPIFVLYLLILFVAITFVALIFLIKVNMSLLQKSILIGGILLVASIPFIVKSIILFTDKYLINLNKDTKQQFLIFLFSIFLILLLNGIVVPANLISSSPTEFSFVGTIDSPLTYILYTFSLFLGLSFVWPLIIYGVSNTRLRSLISFTAPIIATSSIINIFIFKGDYGDINNLMIFEDSSRLATNSFQAFGPIFLVLFIIFALTLLINKKYLNSILSFLIILVLTSIVSGSIALVNISKSYKDYKINISDTNEAQFGEYGKIEPLLPLSKTDKNVVVLFLDRAISSYLPVVFSQLPELEEEYRGFVYYPNTLSYGMYTISGAPPIMGGYEYTPEAMNNRNNEKLVDKHNESSLVMPLIFSDHGYKVTLFNPPLPNYKWVGDLSPFKPYEGIDAYETRGRLTLLYKSNHTEDFVEKAPDYGQLIQRRLTMYSILKSILPIGRSLLYDDRTYYLVKENTGTLESFIDCYAELYYLPELTNIYEGNGSYVFFVNDTPHQPEYLQSPQFIPTDRVTDISNPLMNLEGFGKVEQQHYHANAATLLTLTKWFNYLKEEGVYDNTRIILVSDHGYDLKTIPFENFEQHAEYKAKYNPLLVVKDFDDKNDFRTDNTFMTNGDVPILASKDLIVDLINPFTNEDMRQWVQKDSVKVYKTHNHINKNKGNTFTFEPELSFIVRENIFVEENWTPFQ